MNVDSVTASLKQLFTQFSTHGSFTHEIDTILQEFKDSDNWDICQKILSEQYCKENHNLMIFCAQCCSKFAENYWIKQQSVLKQPRREFIWQFVTLRTSGPSAVPLPLLNTMINVCSNLFLLLFSLILHI